MKTIALGLGLFFVSAVSIAAPPFCDGLDGIKYSHCTYFVSDSTETNSYQIQVILEDEQGVQQGYETCVRGGMHVYFNMDHAVGPWTRYINMGYLDAEGEIFYLPYAEQGFYHSSLGLAEPSQFEVYLDPTIPALCELDMDIEGLAPDVIKFN